MTKLCKAICSSMKAFPERWTKADYDNELRFFHENNHTCVMSFGWAGKRNPITLAPSKVYIKRPEHIDLSWFERRKLWNAYQRWKRSTAKIEKNKKQRIDNEKKAAVASLLLFS